MTHVTSLHMLSYGIIWAGNTPHVTTKFISRRMISSVSYHMCFLFSHSFLEWLAIGLE